VPSCEAKLQIDPELKAVISFEEHKRPPAIEDIGAAVQELRGEEARRARAPFFSLVLQHALPRGEK